MKIKKRTTWKDAHNRYSHFQEQKTLTQHTVNTGQLQHPESTGVQKGERKNPKAKLGLYQIFIYNLSGDSGHNVGQFQNKKHNQERYTKPFFN